MKFYRQTARNNCQIIAIKTVLSEFNIFLSDKEIRTQLPKHSFGNLITELGVYFENLGFKTNLYSNKKASKTSLDIKKYTKLGNFIDREIQAKDFKSNPFIINIDWTKVKKKVGKRSPHYVVVLKEDNTLFLYDGSNYKRKVKRTFEEINSYTVAINRTKDTGMWLEILPAITLYK